MKALVFANRVHQVVPDGEEFEVHGDMVWVDASEDVTTDWVYVDGKLQPPMAAEITYDIHRLNNYPTITQQLDILYHQGYDGWKAAIQTVKEQFPKPEVK